MRQAGATEETVDLRQWCLEFGIAQEFDADDAVELIKAYESLYVPIHGRASTEQQVRPDKSGKCAYPKAFIVCSWFDAGLCKSPDGICRST